MKFNIPLAALNYGGVKDRETLRIDLKVKGLLAEVMVFDGRDKLDKKKRKK